MDNESSLQVSGNSAHLEVQSCLLASYLVHNFSCRLASADEFETWAKGVPLCKETIPDDIRKILNSALSDFQLPGTYLRSVCQEPLKSFTSD